MAHRRFEFEMLAPGAVVFDAFHYHFWRRRWDSLVAMTRVLDGAPCPYVGAVTQNKGAGLMGGLSMSTQFVAFERPRVAAAKMLGASFPFVRWAASMHHREGDGDRSTMIYTYTFETGYPGVRWLVEPVTQVAFDAQTRRRFARLQRFVATHRDEITAWQQSFP